MLSNTVSQAIKYWGERGLLQGKWRRSISYSYSVIGSIYLTQNPNLQVTAQAEMHTQLYDQNSLLDQSSIFITDLAVRKHKSFLPFQKQIKINLWVSYSTIFKSKSSRNFCFYIRGMGRANDDPSPLNFQYRIVGLSCGRSVPIFTVKQNTASLVLRSVW